MHDCPLIPEEQKIRLAQVWNLEMRGTHEREPNQYGAPSQSTWKGWDFTNNQRCNRNLQHQRRQYRRKDWPNQKNWARKENRWNLSIQKTSTRLKEDPQELPGKERCYSQRSQSSHNRRETPSPQYELSLIMFTEECVFQVVPTTVTLIPNST